MKPPTRLLAALIVVVALSPLPLVHAQRQMEILGRGVVAIHQPDGRVFVSWRLLGTDPENIAFNLYQKSEGGRGSRGSGRGGGAAPGERAKLNREPLIGFDWF